MSAASRTIEPVPASDWAALNAEILSLELRAMSCRIRGETDTLKTKRQIEVMRSRLERPCALDTFCARFGLDEIERDIVVMALLADGTDGAVSPYGALALAAFGRPKAALAMAHFGQSAREALSPDGALRGARLLCLDGDAGLADRILRLPEAVAWFLRGQPVLSQAVSACISRLPKPTLALGRDAAVHLGQLYMRALEAEQAIRFGVIFHDATAFLETLHAAMLSLDTPLFHLRLQDVPTADRVNWCRELSRDIGLCGALPVLEVTSKSDPVLARSILEHCPGPVFVIGPNRIILSKIGTVALPLEAKANWPGILDELPDLKRESISDVEDVFDLDATQARRAAQATLMGLQPNIWQAARQEGRNSIETLAKRAESRANWSDLILPKGQQDALKQMSSFLVHRKRVSSDWGYADRSSRGLGMAALFHGPSGTGKTTAAEILVREMAPDRGESLDLYRVDVSTLISKYIGETSKNFAAIFDAGEKSGAALLFDEAEGLFARRTSTGRDSNDKNANAELGFLLQCLESYSGIAILTTNMRNVIDDAFLRRFRFVIEFPFPDRLTREKIWRTVIPSAAPTSELDYAALSRLSLSGGNIRSIAVNAAFDAASEGGLIDMARLAKATRYEFGKLDKSAPETDLRQWVSS